MDICYFLPVGIYIIPLAYYYFHLWILRKELRSKPKEYSKKKIKEYGNCDIRKGYTKKKVNDNLDVIVIGSGLGGLTCAGLLSRVGKRVLVLEQHYIAGGCCHSFDDKGYEFDTGLHYVGNVKDVNKVLDKITCPKIKWAKMGLNNDSIYDEIYLDNFNFNFKGGEDKLIKEVKKHFPEEVDNIKLLIKDVKKISKNKNYFISKVIKSRCLSRLFNKYLYKFYYYMNISAEDGIKKYIKNPRLQKILLSQFGDYGNLPSEQNFFLHAGVLEHYLNGAYYPIGGTNTIARSIVPIIRSTGGDVLVRKAVKKIIVKNNKAIGVEMSNGDKIYAKTIVAACGVTTLYKKLLEPQNVPKNILQKLDKVGLTTSCLNLFVGIEGSPSKYELRSSNIWHIPSEDFKEVMDVNMDNIYDKDLLMFIGFPCAKDPKWSKRFPNKSNCVIITLCKYDLFKKWENTKLGKRGEDYEEFKNKMTKKMLKVLYKYYPSIKGNVEYTNLGSPLTFNHYINSNQGEIYGLKNTTDRFEVDDWLRPQTNIQNLFITGQDVLSHGITGALNSGLLTTYSILGYGTLFDLLIGRDLMKDLKNI